METPGLLAKPKILQIEKDSIKYEFIFNILSNSLTFTIKILDTFPSLIFSNNFEKNNLEQKCKLFKMYENIEECLNLLKDFIEKNNYSIKRSENEILLIISPKILNLNDFELQLKLKEINQNEKIDAIFKKMNDIIKENKELKERVSKLEEKLKSFESQNKNLVKKNIFEEIDNPWSNKTPPLIKQFCYQLKDSNYLAEKIKEDGYIYAIRSEKNLQHGEIYKIQFIIHYPAGNDFQVGFGDPSELTGWIKENNSVCLTNGGLYLNNKLINSSYIIKDNQKIEFIINLSKNESFFELYIDDVFINKYNFVINNQIYVLAAIRALKNAVEIKTYKFI